MGERPYPSVMLEPELCLDETPVSPAGDFEVQRHVFAGGDGLVAKFTQCSSELLRSRTVPVVRIPLPSSPDRAELGTRRFTHRAVSHLPNASNSPAISPSRGAWQPLGPGLGCI